MATGSWVGAALGSGTSATTNFVANTNNIVQLTGLVVLPGIELPSQARSALIMRPFDQELLTCQRYWQKSYEYATLPGAATIVGAVDFTYGAPVTTRLSYAVKISPTMRIAPTVVLYDAVGAANKVYKGGNGKSGSAVPSTGMLFVFTDDATSANEFAFHYTLDARL
jgi:hypothetical protein